MGRYRFVFWVVLFSVLLSIIPILFINGQPETGKIFGAILIFSLSVALWVWRKQTIKQIAYNQRVRLNTNDRFWLNANVNFYKNLNPKEKLIFEDRLGLILSNVQITNNEGKVPDRIHAISLAALATIFLWDLPLFVFENSHWIIADDVSIDKPNSSYVFSLVEIKEKLKLNLLLRNLNSGNKFTMDLGCTKNFLSDIEIRNKKPYKASYENQFWIFFTNFLKDLENSNLDF
jgi:hypothetical protein